MRERSTANTAAVHWSDAHLSQLVGTISRSDLIKPSFDFHAQEHAQETLSYFTFNLLTTGSLAATRGAPLAMPTASLKTWAASINRISFASFLA